MRVHIPVYGDTTETKSYMYIATFIVMYEESRWGQYYYSGDIYATTVMCQNIQLTVPLSW